jgi:hypothetical protein
MKDREFLSSKHNKRIGEDTLLASEVSYQAKFDDLVSPILVHVPSYDHCSYSARS